MVVSVLARNLEAHDVSVTIEPTRLFVTVPSSSVSSSSSTSSDGGTVSFILKLNLRHPIVPEQSSHRILAARVEVHLKKADSHQWQQLEGDGVPPSLRLTECASASMTGVASSADSGPPVYPSSSRTARDWNKIDSALRRQEDSEKPEGEEAVNNLFQKIFADGSDDVRRAMNKSFTESGGTVLSTNWKDIGSKKTEIKPPDGMEYKKWES